MKKQLIWVLEWRKSVHYWWSYILFAPECKGLTCMLDPLLYRWGVPPVVIRCVHWTMQSGVLQTWITIQSPVVVMISQQYCDLEWSIRSSEVRCIPWVQMGTFNKEIGFLCGLKFFALNIFCVEYLQSSLYLMLQIWWKLLLWKMRQ